MASGWNLWVWLICIGVASRCCYNRYNRYNREAVSTLHVALENGSDVHVNERQKIRHYRGRSTGEE